MAQGVMNGAFAYGDGAAADISMAHFREELLCRASGGALHALLRHFSITAALHIFTPLLYNGTSERLLPLCAAV